MKFVVWKDEFGTHRAKIIELGGEFGMEVRWTDSCTGCLESEDGHPVGVGKYLWDEKAGCYLGSGCEECGYRGKRQQINWAPLPQEVQERIYEYRKSQRSSRIS